MNAVQIVLTAVVGFGFVVTAGWLVVEIINMIDEKQYQKKIEKENEASAKFWAEYMKEDDEPK